MYKKVGNFIGKKKGEEIEQPGRKGKKELNLAPKPLPWTMTLEEREG